MDAIKDTATERASPRGTQQPEILSPVHDLTTIIAAANGGADAAYFGFGPLQMRQHGGEFLGMDLLDTVAAIRQHGMRAYRSVNSVVHEDELPTLAQAIEESAEADVDAVIVHDRAAIEMASAAGLEFHISTMTNVTNSRAARHCASLGATRVVLARELGLTEIRRIADSGYLELEVFVHGAQCMSYSGRCFASQILEGKSACRGECTQPCRRRYRLVDDAGTEILMEGPWLSTNDLCSIDLVPALVGAGVNAFKIEGRRRGPEYVETTARCYREAARATAPQFGQNVGRWRAELAGVENRGYSEGYLRGRRSARILGGRSDRLSREDAMVPLAVVDEAHETGASVTVSRDALRIGQPLIAYVGSEVLRFQVAAIEIGGGNVDGATAGQQVLVRGVSGVGPGTVLLGARPSRRRREGSRGILVSVEGGDRAGKSSLVAGLCERLEEHGLAVVATREPGGTPLAEKVRRVFKEADQDVDPVCEALLIAAGHRDLAETVIAPNLETADIVICDRYTDSTLAYQGYARGATVETVRRIQEVAGGPVPDLTLLLDAPVEVLEGRRAGEMDRLEAAELEAKVAVREGFLSLAAEDPLRFVVLDAEEPMERILERAHETVVAAYRGAVDRREQAGA